MLDDLLTPGVEALQATPAWSTGTLHLRLLEVAAAGALAALLLVLFWLQLRPDFWVAIGQPFFWIKALYTVALAAIALVAATAAARPGAALWPACLTGVAVLGAMVLSAVLEAPGLGRAMMVHIFDPTGARNCLTYVVILAAPMLLVAGLGLRRVELERPGLTGLFVGLFCGSVSASIYGGHCQDSTYLFVVLWFSLGVALCGVIGAVGLKLIHTSPQTDPLLADPA